MRAEDVRTLILSYLDAYNAGDVDAMMALVHPEVVFRNVSGSEQNAEARGREELREMAEASKRLFISRSQKLTALSIEGDRAEAEIDFRATLAEGGEIGLKGRSEIIIKAGKIFRLTDHS